MALLMIGVATKRERGEFILWLAILILILAGVFIARGEGTETLFHSSFIVDPFARVMKLLTLTGAAAALVMSVDYWRGSGGLKFEFPVLVLLASTGMMMMISANDLISLYVGLELQSLSLYVTSLVYGFTGSTDFATIAAAVQPSGENIGLIFGLVFLMAGFAFKISAVPFHMWTPDVYEGAPTPVTAFFAAAPKLAAMALTARVLITAFPAVTLEWRQIVVFLAIASMALGSFAAIGQTNIKRLMAYSSIGHMGYALVGLAAGTTEGIQGVLVYMAIYVAMTLGTFACILAMRRDGRMVEDIDQLSGLSSTSPLMAFLLAMLLFSLAGVPPLAGFFAKFYVFLAAIHAGLYALAVIGVLLSVVGAYYYLRIVNIMYFDAPAERFEPMDTPLAAVLGVSGLFILLYFIYPAPLVAFAGAAAKSLF